MEFITNTIGSTVFQSITICQEENPDSFVINMLSNNEIGGLLPITVIRKNLDIEVRYNVTSLVPLSQMMQEPLSKEKVLNILKSIVLAVMQSEEYMLDMQGFDLDEEKIFVNIITGEAKLMYLPVANPETVDVMGFIKKLITSLQYAQGEDSSYILKLMNALNGGSISTVAELDEFIRSLEKEKTPGKKQNSKPVYQQEKIEAVQTPQMPKNPESVNSMAANINPVPPEPSPAPSVIPYDEREKKISLFGGKSKDKSLEQKEQNKEEKPKNKLFGKKSKEDTKAATPGKLPGFAIPGMNDSVGLPITPQEVEQIPEPPKERGFFKHKQHGKQQVSVEQQVQSGQPALAGQQSPVGQPSPVEQQSPVRQQPSARQNHVTSGQNDLGVGAYSAMDYGNTIMINQNNSLTTVMLDENGAELDEPTRASVTRLSNNQKMFIDKDILKIGKESDYVDFYIGNNPTVSRTHADVVRKEGKFYIRDNNSKNHTFLNGEMIIPGELVLLRNNDKITLSNEELIFQLF